MRKFFYFALCLIFSYYGGMAYGDQYIDDTTCSGTGYCNGGYSGTCRFNSGGTVPTCYSFSPGASCRITLNGARNTINCSGTDSVTRMPCTGYISGCWPQ